MQVDEAELLKANLKLKELFRSFDEGGQYTEKAVAAVRTRLDFIIEQAGLARHDVKLDCDELQVGVRTSVWSLGSCVNAGVECACPKVECEGCATPCPTLNVQLGWL
jgi:hypothetical protein